MVSWSALETHAPDLAAFGAGRLAVAAAYLATSRKDGRPRVHPVAPIVGGGRLFVFMEPTSPKVHDLRHRRWYALHNGELELDEARRNGYGDVVLPEPRRWTAPTS
jgi:hypothetical protein